MRVPAAIVFLALAGCESPTTPPVDPVPQDAGPWLARVDQELVGAMTLQWKTRVVRESKGESAWRFETKGADQLHYVCDETTEGWYEGGPLYVRHGSAGLTEIEWAEHEAANLISTVLHAGLFAWLASRAQVPVVAVRARNPRTIKEGEIDGRPAVCIGQDLDIGGIDDDWRRFGSSLLWIDRATGRPLRRELEIIGEGRVTEVYSEWRVDELIDERIFHAPGAPTVGSMPRSRDPDTWEVEATKLFAGVDLRPLSDSSIAELKTEKLLDLKLNVENLGEMKDPDKAEDAAGVPAPAHDRPMFNAVARRGPGGRWLEAWAGTYGDLAVEPADWIREDALENRRHRYEGLGHFVGLNLYVGEVEGATMHPSLYFRDFGQHQHGVADLAVDSKGLCHVVVVDVDESRGARAKVLYLVGDPATHAWTEAWILHHRVETTSSTRSAVCAGDGVIDLAWGFDGERARDGVFFIERDAKGFGRPLRVWNGPPQELAMARDSAGAVMIVWSPGAHEARRFFRAILRKSDGTWTRPAELEAYAAGPLGLIATGAGTFRLRAYAHKTGRRAAGLFDRVTEWTLREAP